MKNIDENNYKETEFQEIHRQVQKVQKIKMLSTGIMIIIMAVLCILYWNASEVYVVKLPADREAGYEWTYTLNPEGIIKEQTSAYSDGVFTFEFIGVERGSAEIQFACIKDQKQSVPEKAIIHEVKVDKSLNIIEKATHTQNL